MQRARILPATTLFAILLCCLALSCASKQKRPSGTRFGVPRIKRTMDDLRPQFHACYQQHGKRGHVQLRITIAPDGSVSEAEAIGRFKGTPSGACAQRVVSAARFDPAESGNPMTIQYPVLLQ